MVFGVERLARRGDRWGIVYEPGSFTDLEEIAQHSVIYLTCEGRWESVDISRAEHFAGDIDGEWYEGPVVRTPWSGPIAVPGVQVGEWVAIRLWDKTHWWPLEVGMLVKTLGGLLYGDFALAPQGRVVCGVYRPRGKHPYRSLGKVAFDLSYPPFPPEMCYYDGEEFQETELRLSATTEDIELTKRFFGTIDEPAWFWLFLS